MSWLAWVAVGLIAGVVAKMLLPGRDPGGCIITTVIGIVGALLGGFLASQVFGYDVNEEFNLPTIAVAVVGAIVLLLVYRLISGRRR